MLARLARYVPKWVGDQNQGGEVKKGSRQFILERKVGIIGCERIVAKGRKRTKNVRKERE